MSGGQASTAATSAHNSASRVAHNSDVGIAGFEPTKQLVHGQPSASSAGPADGAPVSTTVLAVRDRLGGLHVTVEHWGQQPHLIS
jgi:hypothetical protein